MNSFDDRLTAAFAAVCILVFAGILAYVVTNTNSGGSSSDVSGSYHPVVMPPVRTTGYAPVEEEAPSVHMTPVEPAYHPVMPVEPVVVHPVFVEPVVAHPIISVH